MMEKEEEEKKALGGKITGTTDGDNSIENPNV